MEKWAAIQSYRDLLVWQRGMDIVSHIYRLTRQFPDDERYGLCVQLRRAAVSVPSNIAEGYGRNSTSDYIRFLRVAMGSLYEIETQIEIAFREGYIDSALHTGMIERFDELEKMIIGMIKKIEKNRKEA